MKELLEKKNIEKDIENFRSDEKPEYPDQQEVKIESSNPFFNELKEKVQKILERASAKAKTFIIYGMIILAAGSPETALAKAIIQIKNEKGNLGLVVEDKNNKTTHHLEAVQIDDIGSNPTKEKIDSSVFEKIKNTDTHLEGVNYEISSQEGFRSFILEQALVKSQQLGFGFAKLTPKELVLLTAIIIEDNLEYENRANWLDSKNYSKEIDDKINSTPLDQLLIQDKKGVCRHYSVLYEVVLRQLIGLSQSPYLKNIAAKEMPNPAMTHAYNVVFEAVRENGEVVIKMSFLDATFDDESSRFNDNLGAGDELHGGKDMNFLGATFRVFELFNLEEQVDILDAFKTAYGGLSEEYNKFVRIKYRLIMSYSREEMKGAKIFPQTPGSEMNIKNAIQLLIWAWEGFKQDIRPRNIFDQSAVDSEKKDLINSELSDYILWYAAELPDKELDSIVEEAISLGIFGPAEALLVGLKNERPINHERIARHKTLLAQARSKPKIESRTFIGPHASSE